MNRSSNAADRIKPGPQRAPALWRIIQTMPKKKVSDSRLINRFLYPLGKRFPRAALFIAGLLGQLGIQAGEEPYTEEGLATLVGERSKKSIKRLIHRLLSHHNRDRLFVALLNTDGYEKVRPLMKWENKETLLDCHANKRAALLVNLHAGAARANQVGLYALNIPVVVVMGVIRGKSRDPRPCFITISPSKDAGGGPLVMRRALEELRKGGVVYMAMDSRRGEASFEIPFLGRRLPVPRGVSVLAERSDAVVLPYFAWWHPWRPAVHLRLQDPLQWEKESAGPIPSEEALLRAMARVYEDWLRENPEQIRLNRLQEWANLPPWEN